MNRKDYTIVLEIIPTAPLTHGAGTQGNEQVLHTREVVVQTENGLWDRIEIPAISGASLKSTLREWAVRRALDACGVKDGTVSKDALRLLVKGGRNDKGCSTLSLDQARRLRRLFPLLAVFGSMDGGLPIRGQVYCSDVLPYCESLVAEGLVTRCVTPLEVEVDGETITPDMKIDVYPDTAPIPDHLTRTRIQNYRHDLTSGTLVPKLRGTTVAIIEDRRVENADKRGAKKRDRREANESMPYSAQAIAPGTPMVATIRLQGATDVEFSCLAHAIADWIRSGAHLGGGTARGHGSCRVKVAGALRYSPQSGEVGAEPGTTIELSEHPGNVIVETYSAHLAEVAEEVRQYVTESTR